MKDKNEVQKALDQLWSSYVEDFQIDILNHSVSFNLRYYEPKGDYKLFKIIFQGVSAYYFIEYYSDDPETRFMLANNVPEEDDQIEFTSANYYSEGVRNLSFETPFHKVFDVRHKCLCNFVIELGVSLLFIESNKMVINGEVFEFDYPSRKK
jgi:hypothetical protein